MKIGYGDPEERMNRYSPWKRKRPEHHDPSEIACTGDKEMTSKSFQLHRHSNLFRLCPGDMVVAIGRSCTGTRELMAAPGKFSLDCCEFDCKELFRANCIISKVMKGSPAEQAGILHSDVVVQCGKKVVESFLEFYDIIWKKVGKTVKVVVVRESSFESRSVYR